MLHSTISTKIIMEKLLVLLYTVCIYRVASIDPDIIAQLTKEAENIPKKRLDDAFFVRQNPESDNIQYLHHKIPIFTSKNMDQKDQKIIVLSKKEDGLDDCGDKTTYVVLKLMDKSTSKYDVLYAYLRSKGKNKDSRTIEWENYTPRGGGARNKAFIFGHDRCSRSIFTSCKLDKPEKNFWYSRNMNIREKRKKNDCVCDIINTAEEAQLSGTILTDLNLAVTILAGADLLYKDEMKTQRDIVQQLMTEQRKQLGRTFSIKTNTLLQNMTELAAGKFVEEGKQSLSSGVLMFYFLISSIGQLAEKLVHLENKDSEELKAEMRKKLGTKLLDELFKGNFDVRANGTNPFPGLLMKENIARQIASGGQQEEEEDEEESKEQQAGRSWLTKLGVRPPKANENSPSEKSAGQAFAQNTKAGVYAPYGVDVSDSDTQVLGNGTKTPGGPVDVTSNVLKPVRPGPLGTLAAGITIGAKLFGFDKFLGKKKKKPAAVNDFSKLQSFRPAFEGALQPSQLLNGITSTLGITPQTEVKTGDESGNSALTIEMETELDMFTEWGWISQSVSVQNLWMELKEPNIFVGFGTSYSENPIQDDDFDKIATYESYIDYLMLLFRIDNRKELRKQIIALVDKKYISYDENNKTFILQEKSSILTEENLTPDEEVYLFLSFELVSFSKAYKSMVDFLLLLQCPTGERLSKSVALIQLMTQEYLSLVFTYGDVHMVKLLRNYGYTLKTMYTKSLQDVYRYNTCKKCTPESISMVDNNAITLYGLMQWVLYGSWDYYVNNWGADNAAKFKGPAITNMYNAYFTLNRDDFITSVSSYII